MPVIGGTLGASMMEVPAKRYAFFDLDGTLLPWDTQLMFCNFVLQKHPWRRLYQVLFFLMLPLAALRILRGRSMKRFFLGYLAGATPTQMAQWASEFAAGPVRRHVWPEMLAEVEARRRDGCILVLNTASPMLYAEAIARELGFEVCLGTRVQPYTRLPWVPNFVGPNNKREAKIAAMRHYGPLDQHTPLPIAGSWAYTDSPVDIPLLGCAEHGVLVHPKPGFAQLCPARGWRIVLPRPAVSRAQWRWASLAMLFGIWNG